MRLKYDCHTRAAAGVYSIAPTPFDSRRRVDFPSLAA